MRYLICVLSLLFVFASQGANSPSSVTSVDGGQNLTWSNPGNATASDNTYATVDLNDGETSYYLWATGFGFSIPSGTTIDGILSEFELSTSDYDFGTIREVWIIKSNVLSGSDYGDLQPIGTSEAYYQYGGSTLLWGTTWTYSDINSSGFGTAVSINGENVLQTYKCDHIRITVYYTVASTGVKHRVFGYGGGVTRDEVL